MAYTVVRFGADYNGNTGTVTGDVIAARAAFELAEYPYTLGGVTIGLTGTAAITVVTSTGWASGDDDRVRGRWRQAADAGRSFRLDVVPGQYRIIVGCAAHSFQRSRWRINDGMGGTNRLDYSWQSSVAWGADDPANFDQWIDQNGTVRAIDANALDPVPTPTVVNLSTGVLEFINGGHVSGLFSSDVSFIAFEPVGTSTDLQLRFTAGALTVDSAVMPVAAGGGGGGSVGTVFLAADWGTATGNSATAVGDGGLWDNFYSPGNWEQSLSVITAGTAPAPFARTPNVFRIRQLGEAVNGTVEKLNALPLNQSYRGQIFVLNGGDTQTMNHPMSQNVVGGFQTMPLGWRGRAGDWSPFIRSFFTNTGAPSDSGTYPRNQWTIGTLGSPGYALLPNNTWYRYRWRVEIVTPGTVTTYRLYPQIYSYNNANPTALGTLLFDANSYFWQDTTGAAGETLQAFYDGGGLLGMPSPALARNFGFGQEGPATAINTGAYFYSADLTLTSDGWPD